MEGMEGMEGSAVVFTWFGPSYSLYPDGATTSFEMREADSEGVSATAFFPSNNTIEMRVSADTSSESRAMGVSIVGVTEPSKVDITSWDGALCSDQYVARSHTLTVTCKHAQGGLKVSVLGVSTVY